MSAFIKLVSRFENRMDALMERFIFHHKLLGLLLIFIGMPFITLAAVCVCTMLIVLPIALLFG